MQPERLPPLPEEERRLRKKNNLPAFLLAGVVIGLLGFGMNRLMTPPDSSGAGNTAAVVAPATTDHLTQSQIHARAEQFARQAVYAVRSVPPEEVQQRVEAMPLDAAAKWQLQNQLLQPVSATENIAPQTGAAPAPAATIPAGAGARLVELTLWDDVAQDGDVVMVTSAGYSQQVNLMHAPQTLAFPTITGSPVTITGVHDGGGGITLGFTGSGVPVALPVLAEGQSIDLYLQ